MKRISFFPDKKIDDAIESLGSKMNVSQFLRTAIHFYIDNYENVASIEKNIAEIKKQISSLGRIEPTGSPDNQQKQNKSYNRSKAINNILNMGGD